MKILIWISSFFIIVGIPNAIIIPFGLKFGAIPTVLLSGAAYATAKALCKKWDEHQADKKNKDTEHTENADTAESDYTVVVEIPEIPEVKTEVVGTDDKKHSFKNIHICKGTTAALIIISLLLASSVVGNIYQAQINTTLQDTITKNENKITTMQQDLATKNQNLLEYRDEIYDLKNEIYELENSYEEKIAFYNKYVVIVSDDNTNQYHKYGCKYCDTSSFWVYNVKAARDRGYSPCRTCCY